MLCLCFSLTSLSFAAAEVFSYFGNGSDLKTTDLAAAEDGDPVGSVFPGQDNAPLAAGNTVTINYTQGSDPWRVFGGLSNQEPVSANTVYFTNGTVRNSLYGGFDAGEGTEPSAFNNRIVISGGTISVDAAAGFSRYGNAVDNIAEMTGGLIQGGKIGEIYEDGNLYGGRATGAGNALRNIVHLSGGSVLNAIGGRTASGNAEANLVVLDGGVVSNGVYGGYSESGNAVNNSVTIYGTPDLTAASLYGGCSENGNAFTGNTLNLHNLLVINGLGNFQNYNFYLPANFQLGQTVLEVTNGNGNPTPGSVDIDNTTINLGLAGGSSPLRVGNQIVLIQSDNAGLNGEPANRFVRGKQGVTLVYDFELTTNDTQLLAEVTAARANPQLQSLSAGWLAGLALVNQGGDLLLRQGFWAMLGASAAQNQARAGGFAPYLATSGNFSRYNLNGRLDLSSLTLNTGLTRVQPLNGGQKGVLLLGLFFEAGWGSYQTFNAFANDPSVRGSGNTSYFGAGLLGRYDFGLTKTRGFYVEASLRAGQVHTSFAAPELAAPELAVPELAVPELADFQGTGIAYESAVLYYGGQLGLGLAWNFSDRISLDLATRLLWTRQNGTSLNLLGDGLSFAAADSLLWRSGVCLTRLVSDRFSAHAGIYFEYEFAGQIKAQTNGYEVDAPSLRGGTGLAELGLSLHPSPNLPLSITLDVQGFWGRRRGASGSLLIKYVF